MKKGMKTKRGKKKQKEDESKLEFYYNNINGLLTKQYSLQDIVDMRKPDLLALCETKLHKNSSFELEGYGVKKSNLKAGKEGILVAAKNGTYNTMELVFESESRQIATVEIGYPEEKLRITVVHGPQALAGIDEKEEFKVDLQAEIQRSLDSGCRLLVVGDFNSKLEHQNGNIMESSGNGKRMREMVEEYDLSILNIRPNTEGKWTRIQKRNDELQKSEIDFIIADTKMCELAEQVVIDEDKLFTPYRTMKRGINKSIVFSDHCAMTTSFGIRKGANTNKRKTQKTKIWKLTEDGMNKYKEVTQKDLGMGVMSSYKNPFDVWRKKVDNVMHECFTKITIRAGENDRTKTSRNGLEMRKIIREVSKRGKIQRQIMRSYSKHLLSIEAKKNDKKRAENLRKTVNTLSNEDKLSPNAFWKLKKSTSKYKQLKLPEVYKKDGSITTDPDEIKEEAKGEFEHRLRN